jgi:transketolase
MVAEAMRDSLLETVFNCMGRDKKICFISADFGSPILDKIRQEYPERFVNVGIAEQNLINVSTGFALEGCTVFAYAIAPFITMRCYEQIRVNLAILSQIRKVNVNLIGVGAGFSYVVSGPTHQCFEDISIMRTLPNIEVLSVADAVSARQIIPHCLNVEKPSYVRLDAQVLPDIYEEKNGINVGAGFNQLRSGKSVCLLSTGYMTHVALRVYDLLALEKINIAVVDIHNLTNYDSAALRELIEKYEYLLTVEEGFIGKGGLDALARGLISDGNIDTKVISNGLNSVYRFELMGRASLHEVAGIGEHAMAAKVRELIKD